MPAAAAQASWRGHAVLVAGASGVLGAPLVSQLRAAGADVVAVRRHHGDLRDADFVEALMTDRRYDAIFLVAGPSGGLAWQARHGADLGAENAAIAETTIKAAIAHGVPRLIYAASAAGYPANAEGLLDETMLDAAAADEAHRPYSEGKQVGVDLCDEARSRFGLRYASAILTNMFGPGACLELARAHVVSALIVKALSMAGTLKVGGGGGARRPLLFGQDAAAALMAIGWFEHDWSRINVTAPEQMTIAELARTVARQCGKSDDVEFIGGEEGVAGRTLDRSRIRAIGQPPQTPFEEAIAATIADARRRLALT
jgi:GDP-L-fucose synthase